MSEPVIAEYIWIDGTGENLRSKARTLDENQSLVVEDLPLWNFDGSSTYQAVGDDSEIMLKPQAVYKDPFRRNHHILVMCDCYKYENDQLNAIPSNTRAPAQKIFNQKTETIPWFGIEQEYVLFDQATQRPLNWPSEGLPEPQGKYYCGVGTDRAWGRKIAEAHYQACLFAGLKIGGINGEVLPSQWEYQIGPCTGIDSGDQLWVSRYILGRICEEINVSYSLDPKPIKDWNGSGGHVNFSTLCMRQDKGYDEIIKAIDLLSLKHKEHMEVYGKSNEKRLVGNCETSSYDQFSYGVGNRETSVRIPNQVANDQKGYFEDRRPGANLDPYLVTAKIFETTTLPESKKKFESIDKIQK
jgi:glutamine synthetase